MVYVLFDMPCNSRQILLYHGKIEKRLLKVWFESQIL